MVYDPVIEGQRYTFGVSGYLYQRNLLLYDRETDSLWSQLLSQAVTGPLASSRLETLPVEQTRWDAWRKQHPQTRVLSFATGYRRDYRQDPYASYPLDRSRALLVSAGGTKKIYPFAQLAKIRGPLVERLGEIQVTVVFDRHSQTARAETNVPGGAQSLVAFLLDLKAFYPNAQVFQARGRSSRAP